MDLVDLFPNFFSTSFLRWFCVVRTVVLCDFVWKLRVWNSWSHAAPNPLDLRGPISQFSPGVFSTVVLCDPHGSFV